MTAFIVGLSTDWLLAVLLCLGYTSYSFLFAGFDYLLYAGFGFWPDNEGLKKNISRVLRTHGEPYARLSAFIFGLVADAVGAGAYFAAKAVLEVWLGQS